MRKTRKIKDFDSAGKFGKDDNRKILSERLNYLKEHYEGKKITAKEIFNRVKANGGNVSAPDTINKWLQGRIFPSEENLIALAKAFPPYSSDYFRGITKAPDYNYQYIMKETGLSWNAIDHLKKLSKNHKDTLNAVLESEYIEDIVQCIESSKGEKHHVLRDEYNALDYIRDYIDFYSTVSDNDKGLVKIHLDSLQQKIDRLSDEAINKPFDKVSGGSVSAFEIAAYKLRLQESFSEFFKSIVPDLKAYHYPDLKDIFDKFIKPTETFEGYSEEYMAKVLMPLSEILVQEKIGQYKKDTDEGKIIVNEKTEKKLSALYEKAQKIIEASGSETTEKPTQKKSKRKKV